MRLVLVAIHAYPSPQAVPLANALLKAYAAEAGVDVVLHDLYAGGDAAAGASALLALQPDAVGFSVYAWNRADTLAIAAELARRAPAVLLFAGGPEATADAAGLLGVAPLAAVVVGEGEQPFAALCACLRDRRPLAGIPGVLVRGAPASAAAPPPLADLDGIPSPWLSGVLDAARLPGVLWQLARGCSFGCEFCYDARDRHGVRRISMARLEAELRHFVACGVRQVFVLDSTFNQDLPRAKAILRLIRQLAPRIHFHFEVRSEFLDRELAKLFAGISCSLQIGLQSADPAVLKGVGRSFRREDFVAKVGLLNQSGATFGFDLMIGLPGDTLAGFRRSLDFALELYPNQLDIFPLAVLPGTALAARAAALGLQHLPQPPYTLLSTPQFGATDLREAMQLAQACDIFYSRGKAVAWFNGILRALGEAPSVFLGDFARWLARQAGGAVPEPAACGEEQVWQWQRAYLADRFAGSRQRLQGVVLDLVDYHYHYAQAAQSPAKSGRKPQRVLEQAWRLAPGVRIASFRYDILELLGAGEPDPQRFCKLFVARGSQAVIYPAHDGVRTETLHPAYVALLRRLDGRTPAGRLAAQLRLPTEDAGAFLAFAAQEGMIHL